MNYFKASIFVSGATVLIIKHAELIWGTEHDRSKGNMYSLRQVIDFLQYLRSWSSSGNFSWILLKAARLRFSGSASSFLNRFSTCNDFNIHNK